MTEDTYLLDVEYVKVWRANNFFLVRIPLNNCKREKRVLIVVLCRLQLAKWPRMAASRYAGNWLDVIRYLEHLDTWNNLPGSVVEAPSVNSFKSRLNRHWTNHPSKFNPPFTFRMQPGKSRDIVNNDQTRLKKLK